MEDTVHITLSLRSALSTNDGQVQQVQTWIPVCLDPCLNISFSIVIDSPASFVTFSVRGVGKPDQPGNYDPTVALRLSQYSRQPSPLGHGYLANIFRNLWYTTFTNMFHNQRLGGERTTWWKTAVSAPTSQNEMEYVCHADLGSPSAADCNQLEATQLGPPSNTVFVGPGSPKVLTRGSCSVDVVSSTPTYITWNQIAAALGPLLTICLTYGSAKVGGVANYHAAQALPATWTPNVVGRDETQVSGMCHPWFQGT